MSVRCLKIYIKPTKPKNEDNVLRGKCAYFALATYKNHNLQDKNTNSNNSKNKNIANDGYRTVYKSQAFYRNEYYASFSAKIYIKCFTEMKQLFKNAENDTYHPNLIRLYIGSKELYDYLKSNIKPENEKKQKEYKEVGKVFKNLLKSINCRHVQVSYNLVNYDNDKNNKVKDNNIKIVYNKAKTLLDTGNSYDESYKVKYNLSSKLKERDKNKEKRKKQQQQQQTKTSISGIYGYSTKDKKITKISNNPRKYKNMLTICSDK